MATTTGKVLLWVVTTFGNIKKYDISSKDSVVTCGSIVSPKILVLMKVQDVDVTICRYLKHHAIIF